jgi:hypothetical protein
MAAKHPPKQTVAKHPPVPKIMAKHPPNDNIMGDEASARASTKQHDHGGKTSARRH